MKKITFFFILLFFFLPILLFAQDNEIAWNNGDNKEKIITPDKDVVWAFDVPENEEAEEEVIIEKKRTLRMPDRNIEIGLFNFSFGFSNDFMSTSEFFKEKVKINLDKLSDGLNLNFNSSLSPVFLNYNINNTWGFGFSTGLDIIGIIGFNGDMLTFHESNTTESDAGAAVFTDVKIYGFYTLEKFKIKVKPSVYYPILYAKPDNFSYTFKNININGKAETFFNMLLDMRIYTAYQMNEDFKFNDIFEITGNIGKISAKPGIDISIGAEYPLSETLGLTEKIKFLDFDVGIDLNNIPLLPSKMEDYIRTIINLGSNKPLNFFNGMLSENSEENDSEDLYDYKVEYYGKEKRNVFRPFKMIISANWRPFDSPFQADSEESYKIKREWLTFTPMLGFSINPLYYKPVSFEGGITTRFSLYNFIIVKLDTGYYDRLWKNSLNFALNFRIFEVDLGASLQSPNLLKIFSGSGFGAAFGLKFGW